MPNSNKYNKESLIKLNPLYHYEHQVMDSDVEMVNTWVEFIESTRSDQTPQIGDRLLFTSKHGNFSPKALIEKCDEDHLHIITSAFIPFVYKIQKENLLGLSTGGGGFESVPLNLKYVGKVQGDFKDWGHCGSCGYGTIHFRAEVSQWEYAEPNPLYNGFSTKDWRKLYISKPGTNFSTDYLYLGDGIAFRNENKFQEFLAKFKATTFQGHWTNQMVVWCYRHRENVVSKEKWDQIQAVPVMYNNESVKDIYDDENHILNSYIIRKEYIG